MLLRFVDELATASGVANPLGSDAKPEDVETAFASQLIRAAEHRRVVVLLDALNQFGNSARSQRLGWLRPGQWPANARLVATSLPGAEGAQVLGQIRGTMTRALPALVLPDIDAICHRLWRRYGRTINAEVVTAIKARQRHDGQPAAGNPLWLTLLLEQLNLLDADDFARARRSYPGSDDVHKLHALMLDTVREVATEVPGLYRWMLNYTERTYGQALARAFAVLVALSRHGWRERDLLAMVPPVARVLFPGQPVPEIDDLALAALRRGFRAHLVRRGAAAQLDFFHAQMREAVIERSASDDGTRTALHRTVNDYLENLPEDDPLIPVERMWQLLGEHDALRAGKYYATVDVAQAGPMDRKGATWTLVEWLTESLPQDERDGRLQWLCGWLAQPDLQPDEQRQLAANMLNGLAGLTAPFLSTDTLYALALAAHELFLARADAYSEDSGRRRDPSVPYAGVRRIFHALSRAVQVLFVARADPDSEYSARQRDLSVSHEKVGRILQTQGDLAGALRAFRESQGIADRLSGADPSNIDWQRDLSVALDKVGDIQQAQGDLTGAVGGFRKSLEIRERLSRVDSSNARWQSDLSLSHDRVGDILQAQGDLAGAMGAFRKSLEIRERLSRADPGNTRLDRELSLSHNQVGGILQAQGDLIGALEALRNGLSIRERLVHADPSNTEWQRDLSVSHEKIGGVLHAQGDLVGAMGAVRTGLEIQEHLARADPSNTEWQRDLSVSHVKVGSILQARGDLTGAVGAFGKSLEIRERLSRADPSNAQWLHDLSMSQDKVGGVLLDQGDLTGALGAFHESLEIRERLARADPSNAKWQRDLSVSHDQVGGILQAQGDLRGAMDAFRKGLAIQERLALPCTQRNSWTFFSADPILPGCTSKTRSNAPWP